MGRSTLWTCSSLSNSSKTLQLCYLWEKSAKKIDPTEVGNFSKKQKNTAVMFKEKRMNQILQSENKNKMNPRQNMISGVSLGTSFTVIFSKKDEHYLCLRKARFLSC